MDLGHKDIQDMLYDEASDEEAATPKIRRVSRLLPTPLPTPLPGRPVIPARAATPRRGVFGVAPNAAGR